MRHARNPALAFLVAAAVIPTADSAEPASPSELGIVEVIGTRVPAALPLTTDILGGETIATLHRDDLAQALELVPGLTSQNVGQRRERLLALRGFNSRQVPLFIDGVPVYVPYDGNVDLARFGVDYLSEIRVGKGLASLLHGPNIMGGSINVVSRRPSEPLAVSARLSTEVDSRLNSNLQRGALAASGASDRWYGSLSVSGSKSDGYRLPGSFTPSPGREDGGRRDNADARDHMWMARVGFTPDESSEYAVTWYRQEGRKDSPPYAGTAAPARFWDWPYWNKQSFSLTTRNAVAEQGTLRLRAYYDTFENSLDAYTNLAQTTWMFRGSAYNDYAKGASADFEWRWTDAAVTRMAAHFKKDVHREMQEQPVSPRQQLVASTWDIAIEQEWRITAALALTPGYQYVYQPARSARVWNSNVGQYSPVPPEPQKATTSNGQLVAVWDVTDRGSVVGGISRKTRFPALKDRYSGGLGSVVPNPALEAEYANHFELGYSHRGTSWSGKVALYQANLRDAIESVTLPGSACAAPNPNCSQLQNVGRQRNRGAELSGSWQALDTLRLDAQVSLLDRENLGNPALLPTDTPRWTQRVAAGWQVAPRWRLSVDAQHESKRYSTTSGSRVADAFTLVNSFVRYAHNDTWGAELGVRNLGNELYAYQEGFYESGRSWLMQVDWRY
jgi:iron complex outermembrane receptor protein